jgi:FkbM family methyltransferase
MRDKLKNLTVHRKPIWKRGLLLFLRGFILVGGLFMVFEIGCWLHPPLVAWGLGVIDRDRICTTSEILAGAQQHARVYEGGKDLLSNSHLVRTAGKVGLWSSPVGEWWIPKGSEGPVLGFAVQQKEQIYGSGEWGLRKDDVVLDCGANVGVYTRLALDAGAKTVVAIEPAPVNVECLRRNFAAEIASGRVIVAPVGVWDKADVLPLYEDAQNSGADSFVIRGPNDHVTNVPLVTIDQLVKDLKLARVDIIKMDIKGATKKALNGAKDVLAANRPRLAISTEELEDPPPAIREQVLSMGMGYQMACGICAVNGLKVNPDVLLFRVK